MSETFPAADILAIQHVLSIYGHIIDDREWERLAEVFTSDAIFDSTAMGSRLRRSLAELQEDWARPETPHPLAHHATNIVVERISDDEARVVSKGIGLRSGGRAGSVVYRDEVRRTPAGWRITKRVATPRTPREEIG